MQTDPIVQAQVSTDLSINESEYAFRKGILQKDVSIHRLTPTALTIQDDKGKVTPLPYSDIDTVHLSYTQTKYSSFLRCDVATKTGQKCQILSRHYKGFARFESQNPAFVAFVKKLHAQLEGMPSANRQYRKGSTFVFILSIIMMVVFMGLMAIGYFLSQWILIIFIAVGFVRVGYSLPRLMPGSYNPKHLPSWLE